MLPNDHRMTEAIGVERAKATKPDRSPEERAGDWPKTIYPHAGGREWTTSTDGDTWKEALGVEVAPVASPGSVGAREAAERLGVHENTIRNWERQGLLRAGRSPSGVRRFSAADVERMRVEMLAPAPAVVDDDMAHIGLAGSVEGQLDRVDRLREDLMAAEDRKGLKGSLYICVEDGEWEVEWCPLDVGRNVTFTRSTFREAIEHLLDLEDEGERPDYGAGANHALPGTTVGTHEPSSPVEGQLLPGDLDRLRRIAGRMRPPDSGMDTFDLNALDRAIAALSTDTEERGVKRRACLRCGGFLDQGDHGVGRCDG